VGQVKKKENGWHTGQPFSLVGATKIHRFAVLGFRFLVEAVGHGEQSEAIAPKRDPNEVVLVRLLRRLAMTKSG